MLKSMATALLMTFLIGGSALSAASQWTIVPENSTVGFLYTEDGVPQEGAFDRFRGSGTLDPEDPASASLEIEVESKSISLGSGLVDAFATSVEWFDSENHPFVTYRLERLEPIYGNAYLAVGSIVIRGVEKQLTTPLTLEFTDGEARATGEIRLNRRDFGLGSGPSAAFVDIGEEIAVRFDLAARPGS